MREKKEKVVVYKIVDGKRAFVKEFLRKEIKVDSFEVLLKRRVKPRFGAGEYALVGVDKNDGHLELGHIRLA